MSKKTIIFVLIVTCMAVCLTACGSTQGSQSVAQDKLQPVLETPLALDANSATQVAPPAGGQQPLNGQPPADGQVPAMNGTPAPGGQPPAMNGTPGAPAEIREMSAEDRLLIGTFLLEGTAQAITSEQAGVLLPIWQTVKDLSSANPVSETDLQAAYTLIKASMTAEQLSAIDAMDLSMENLQTIVESLGLNIQLPSQDGSQGPGGQPPAGGQPPSDGTMQAPPQNVTPGAMPGGQPPRGGMGIGRMLIDPLLQLLQTRSAE